LYPDGVGIKEKIEKIARELYRAKDVSFSEQAEEKIAMFTAQGFSNLPICMAKTQYSFSHDANLKVGARPTEKRAFLARFSFRLSRPPLNLPRQSIRTNRITRIPRADKSRPSARPRRQSNQGAPSGFTLPIGDVRCSAGAGFIVPLVGAFPTIPGLPTRPAYYEIGVDTKTDRVIGLS
jgi:formate--tetrahydrofolate ligase